MLSSVTENLSLAGILFIRSIQLPSIQCKFWCLISLLISHRFISYEFSLIVFLLSADMAHLPLEGVMDL
jgi:hypothetical protein